MNADSESNTIDLARAADFSLAGLRVRPSLRQAESGIESETLEPRVMQVLVALARQAGQVVSRDALIRSCWGGRIVGDDAISRVIARVRRLGEIHAAFSLETIPRVGYRLMPQGENAAAALPSPAAHAADTETPSSPPPSRLKRPAVWLGAGGGLAALLLAAVLLRPPEPPDVGQVVARLTEKLQQERGPQDAAVAGNAMLALGASRRPEERTAFEALASEDGAHALDILESLARQLEASGDLIAASETYGRLGGIATLFDPLRALFAQRKAFELNPQSLRSFQNLFFTHFFTRDGESERFARRLLEDARLDDRMRGWVFSHLAFIKAEGQEIEDAEATVAKIKALETYSVDPVLQAAAAWAESVIALNRFDYPRAQALAQVSSDMWSQIPEKTSNSAEVVVLRAMFERGDWVNMFREGATIFDHRTREGDLLPGMIFWHLCESGLFTGQTDRALPYCAASVRRAEWHPAPLKGYSAIIAAVEGDMPRARRELETAHGIIPSGGSIPGMILIYEAWIAQRAGDIAEAERLLTQKPGGRTWEEATSRRPSVLAMSRRLHGEWLIAAGEPQRACAPLAEASRAYAAYGGDPGREAVDALRKSVGCPA